MAYPHQIYGQARPIVTAVVFCGRRKAFWRKLVALWQSIVSTCARQVVSHWLSSSWEINSCLHLFTMEFIKSIVDDHYLNISCWKAWHGLKIWTAFSWAWGRRSWGPLQSNSSCSFSCERVTWTAKLQSLMHDLMWILANNVQNAWRRWQRRWGCDRHNLARKAIMNCRLLRSGEQIQWSCGYIHVKCNHTYT